MVVVTAHGLPDHQQHKFHADQQQASDPSSTEQTRAHETMIKTFCMPTSRQLQRTGKTCEPA